MKKKNISDVLAEIVNGGYIYIFISFEIALSKKFK